MLPLCRTPVRPVLCAAISNREQQCSWLLNTCACLLTCAPMLPGHKYLQFPLLFAILLASPPTGNGITIRWYMSSLIFSSWSYLAQLSNSDEAYCWHTKQGPVYNLPDSTAFSIISLQVVLPRLVKTYLFSTLRQCIASTVSRELRLGFIYLASDGIAKQKCTMPTHKALLQFLSSLFHCCIMNRSYKWVAPIMQ